MKQLLARAFTPTPSVITGNYLARRAALERICGREIHKGYGDEPLSARDKVRAFVWLLRFIRRLR